MNSLDDNGIEIPDMLYKKPKNVFKYANSKTIDRYIWKNNLWNW